MIEVLILIRGECDLCDHAKDVLSRLRREFAFTVTEVDMATREGMALAEHGGVAFPPGVFLDGEPFSYGRLSERKLRRELQRRAGDQSSR